MSKFIKLSTDTGQPVLVNADKITYVSSLQKDPSRKGSAVHLEGGSPVFVAESFNELAGLIG